MQILRKIPFSHSVMPAILVLPMQLVQLQGGSSQGGQVSPGGGSSVGFVTSVSHVSTTGISVGGAVTGITVDTPIGPIHIEGDCPIESIFGSCKLKKDEPGYSPPANGGPVDLYGCQKEAAGKSCTLYGAGPDHKAVGSGSCSQEYHNGTDGKAYELCVCRPIGKLNSPFLEDWQTLALGGLLCVGSLLVRKKSA